MSAAGLVLATWLALAAPWLVLAATGCEVPPDQAHPEATQGQESGNPEASPSAAAADITKPIDINNPEERTPTVTAPPELPPDSPE